MTLNELKGIFETISTSHVDISRFDYGHDSNVAVDPNGTYPLFYLDLPYNITYTDDRRFKQYKFGIFVLNRTEQDSVEDNHDKISECEIIGDAILSKIQDDYKSSMILTGLNAVSLDEYSDDYTAGVRYDLMVTSIREYSEPKCYMDKFKKSC
jgi:hypothetical protein